MKSGPVELYRKYRPKSFKEIIGQTAAIKSLLKKIKQKKVPQSIMAVGGSGCGKTSACRVLAMVLGAKEMDITEINSAHFKGIDSIREIRQQMGRAPFGKCRVWILNEAHQYSKPVQDAMLEMLEDTPKHVHFMITTTDPHKLNEAFKQRCMVLKFRNLDEKEMRGLIQSVVRKEKKKLKSSVIDKLIEFGNGSPRKALVILDSILDLKKTSDQLNVIENQDIEQQAFTLARLLMNPWTKWSQVAEIIKAIADEGDTARRIIAGYGTTVALGGGKSMVRGFAMIDAFSEPYYNVSGKTGLTWSCGLMLNPCKSRKK